MRCVPGELVTIATLNTRGIPLTGSRLAGRYAVIGAGFEAGDADVVCCQEVFAEKKEPPGNVSDHIGLLARLSLTASTRR